MGGDLGLRSCVPAAVNALSIFPDIELVLVGDQQLIRSSLHQIGGNCTRLSIVHAQDVVEMNDKPSVALRKKTRSSMRIAIDLLAKQQVDAVVSAGNTGALMAIGCSVLKTLPSIDRPAICAALPCTDGPCYLLDVGANVDSSAKHLHQFAVMGSALCAAVGKIKQPRVAVLNNGEEDIKGNEQVKQAVKLIEKDRQLNFVGSIEGHDLFSGRAHVVVCDGFVGNVALKVCEGTALYISDVFKRRCSVTWWSRAVSRLCAPVFRQVVDQLDPQQYNGASFLGLQGIVVKSHGNSSVKSFGLAIAQARSEARFNMLGLISQRLAALAV